MSEPICYESGFFLSMDKWVYVHFFNSVTLQLFAKDWKLSLAFMVLGEFLEAVLVTIMRSYVFFPGDNADWETLSSAFIGDIGIGILGILVAYAIRTRLAYIPRLIVHYHRNQRLWVIGWVQYFVYMAIASSARSLGNWIYPDDGSTITFSPDKLGYLIVQMLFFYYMYRWTLRRRNYFDIVWGRGSRSGIKDVRRAYGTIALVSFLLILPHMIRWPASMLIVSGIAYIFLVLVLSWSFVRPAIYYRPDIRFQGDEPYKQN